MPIDWGADEPLPLVTLQEAAALLAWMQHLRERSEELMEEYRDAQRELERLIP